MSDVESISTDIGLDSRQSSRRSSTENSQSTGSRRLRMAGSSRAGKKNDTSKDEMNQAMKKASQNVAKAEEIADKSDLMTREANNFLLMAKELNKQNKGWL